LLNHSEHVVTLPVPLFPFDREHDSINLPMSWNRAWVELRTSKNPRGGRMAATQKFTFALVQEVGARRRGRGGRLSAGGGCRGWSRMGGRNDVFGAVFAMRCLLTLPPLRPRPGG
jgi:hypothetical protein